MAATPLDPGLISNIPVVFFNAAGDQVPGPTGGAGPSVSVDDTAAGSVVIGADGFSVDFTPTAGTMAGTAVAITAVFTRADGVTITAEGAFTVGTAVAPPPDTTPVSASFNAAGITTRPMS